MLENCYGENNKSTTRFLNPYVNLIPARDPRV